MEPISCKIHEWTEKKNCFIYSAGKEWMARLLHTISNWRQYWWYKSFIDKNANVSVRKIVAIKPFLVSKNFCIKEILYHELFGYSPAPMFVGFLSQILWNTTTHELTVAQTQKHFPISVCDDNRVGSLSKGFSVGFPLIWSGSNGSIRIYIYIPLMCGVEKLPIIHAVISYMFISFLVGEPIKLELCMYKYFWRKSNYIVKLLSDIQLKWYDIE